MNASFCCVHWAPKCHFKENEPLPQILKRCLPEIVLLVYNYNFRQYIYNMYINVYICCLVYLDCYAFIWESPVDLMVRSQLDKMYSINSRSCNELKWTFYRPLVRMFSYYSEKAVQTEFEIITVKVFQYFIIIQKNNQGTKIVLNKI